MLAQLNKEEDALINNNVKITKLKRHLYLPYDSCYKCQVQCPQGCNICNGLIYEDCQKGGGYCLMAHVYLYVGTAILQGKNFAMMEMILNLMDGINIPILVTKNDLNCFQELCLKYQNGYKEVGSQCYNVCGDGILIEQLENVTIEIVRIMTDAFMCLHPKIILAKLKKQTKIMKSSYYNFLSKEEQFLQMIIVFIENAKDNEYDVEIKSITSITTVLTEVSYTILVYFKNKISNPILKVTVRCEYIVNVQDNTLFSNEIKLVLPTPNKMSNVGQSLISKTVMLSRIVMYIILIVSGISFWPAIKLLLVQLRTTIKRKIKEICEIFNSLKNMNAMFDQSLLFDSPQQLRLRLQQDFSFFIKRLSFYNLIDLNSKLTDENYRLTLLAYSLQRQLDLAAVQINQTQQLKERLEIGQSNLEEQLYLISLTSMMMKNRFLNSDRKCENRVRIKTISLQNENKRLNRMNKEQQNKQINNFETNLLQLFELSVELKNRLGSFGQQPSSMYSSMIAPKVLTKSIYDNLIYQLSQSSEEEKTFRATQTIRLPNLQSKEVRQPKRNIQKKNLQLFLLFKVLIISNEIQNKQTIFILILWIDQYSLIIFLQLKSIIIIYANLSKYFLQINDPSNSKMISCAFFLIIECKKIGNFHQSKIQLRIKLNQNQLSIIGRLWNVFKRIQSYYRNSQLPLISFAIYKEISFAKYQLNSISHTIGSLITENNQLQLG
ncbi:unnamed protein product [Paramecium octaurelia]|uniref:Transmembrane protein n=1 Tax=Paramecium octaurelia TaxID=43137 RepID=A0A8S1YKM1_PAROT|nr:unnamed protein product [Paramecium octaurelia]